MIKIVFNMTFCGWAFFRENLNFLSVFDLKEGSFCIKLLEVIVTTDLVRINFNLLLL
jgi:hypothetical protein